MATVGKAFRDVHFTCDEVQLLTNSLKDEKFRKLLGEFAKEINDPENRKHYEEEVRKWEKQRGVDVVFLDPRPGFALVVGGEASGDHPVCVNICCCDAVQEPNFTKTKKGTSLGHNWTIPHAVTKPREENVPDEGQLLRELRRGQVGKPNANVKFVKVIAYDVVFHPDTLRLASSNDALKNAVIQTAMDALSENFQLKVKDTKELDSVKYIGHPVRSVIKKVVDRELNKQSETLNFLNKAEDERTSRCNVDNKAENQSTNVLKKGDSAAVAPNYSIKHVNKADLQDFTLIPRNGASWRPHALQVDVHLPGVSRAAQVSAEVVEQSIIIDTASTPKYTAEIPLPYAVNEDTSTAKFDVATQKLTLVLTVMPHNNDDVTVPMASPSSSSDSGIECEPGYRTNSDGDNSSEVSVSSQEDGPRDEGVEEEVEDDEGSVFESAPSSPIRGYLVPSYTLQENEKALHLKLNCKNVLPDSIKILPSKNNQLLNVNLTTIGGGLTPLNHGLAVDVGPHEITTEGVSFTISDEHVAVMITKTKSGLWETVRVGKPNSLQKENVARIEEPPVTNQTKEENSKHGLGDASPLKQNMAEGVVRKPRVTRAVSMCEEIPTMPGLRLKGPTCSWPRGILKRRSRSLSESQLSSVTPLESLASLESPLEVDLLEDRDGEESVEESLTILLGEKKSVRFNDVVSRQLFRSNSSILGQRAKNQKKALKKQKCRNRRASEGSDRDSDASQCHSDPGPSSGDLTTTTTTDEDDTDATAEADDILCDVADKMASSPDNSTFVDVDLDVENNNSNNSSSNSSCVSNNKSNTTASSENEDGEGFVVKTSKKKKKNKKKNKKFEPANNFIFQLDIEP
ncbi:protein kintoun [Macrobrachium rosenbergii]|uniref:protein kintoun n=1 Tax=Macrobrachium rosenbergii TaxID=79674 RepID=UPI0034D7716E